MSSDDPVAAFRIEAAEVLDSVESALLDLNDRLDDDGVINAVFRGLHTVKGSGAMFGFDALAAFTHHCETAFDKVRKGQLPATRPLVAVILAACDHMRALLDGAAAPDAGAALLARLDAELAAAGVAPPRGGDAPAGARGWLLHMRLPRDCMANGTNPLLLLDELASLGTATVTADCSAIPPLDALDPQQCHIAWQVRLEGAITRAAIEEVFLFVLDDMELDIAPLDEPGVPSVGAPAPDAPRSDTAAPVVPLAAPVETVRVPADRLDAVMNRVGELVIAQSRLSQIALASDDIALHAVSEEIDRLAGELRTTMMVLRMVPVAQLFGRFRRLVHDLAAETGKAITLEIEGEGTEIDKTVVERLFDPLVHLVRNSCDHGLEPADARLAAGKPAAGRIRLSACQAGGQVVIAIDDDGRGIDVAKVRARAEAQGLVAADAVLSDHDLIQVIFHPGFSTAETVTSLSGRGVGMDVVKRTIDALGGTIAIASRPGMGSTISLSIPLTLAIIEGLLVRVGHGRYVLPLAAVEECLELSAAEDRRSDARSLITLRDRLVPFVRLRDLFRVPVAPDPHQKVVVVAHGDNRVGLVVDQIIGSHQTVIKSMSPLQKGAAAFSGATILGDGTVALILDIANLLARAGAMEGRLRAAS